ncbi:MAG: hypothetical protein Q9160_005856 [Pyrenula sp. 1 TL-2023]
MPSNLNEPSPTLGALVTNTDPAHLPGPKPLTGQHVTLSRLTPDHFPDLYANVGSHASLWAHWPDGPFSTLPDFSAYLQELSQLTSDLAIYSVFPHSGPHAGEALGLAFALSEDRPTNRVAELGLFFGPHLQRTRAGTEVVYLLAGLLFDLNHRRLQWKTNSLNLQSRKAAERYGFVYEGTFRQHQVCKGRNRDTAWYSIVDGEWGACREAFERWLGEGNFDEWGGQRRRLEEIREGLR